MRLKKVKVHKDKAFSAHSKRCGESCLQLEQTRAMNIDAACASTRRVYIKDKS